VASLIGRVAVITGAGDGIGAAVAARFAADGAAAVVLADINLASAQRVAAEIAEFAQTSTLCLAVDVSNEAAVRAMVHAAVAAFGGIDILVNNAWGGGQLGRIEAKTNADLSHGFGVGFYGPFWAMQESFPPMCRAGYGRVINMCSLNGVNAHVGTLEYNVAKEALRTLTRSAAREWANTGIVVNAICPGAKTAASRNVFARYPELEAAADASNPMGRLGDPLTDIAPVVSFLASEDARYLTGNTLFVDGGGHINGVNWVPDLPARSI
jgi:NAD(P)-dependent dehydrogenase (short-subunit alcohol dehydrogenase family)